MSSELETCLRCGAPYEPAQTVCFKCGAPIGETRSSTQPVPAVNVPRAEASGQPAAASAPVGAAAATATPAVPAAATGAAPARQTPRPARTRRRGGLIVLLVCVLVLAAGGGAAYIVRALTATPPVASASVYRDPQHRFSFQRPALWQVTSSADGVTMTDSSGASTAQVTVAAPLADETAQSHARTLAAQLGLTSAPPQRIAGQQWEQLTGQVTGTDGAVRQMAVYVTLHDGDLYTIRLSSPVASYDSTNNLVFTPLLASFAFA